MSLYRQCLDLILSTIQEFICFTKYTVITKRQRKIPTETKSERAKTAEYLNGSARWKILFFATQRPLCKKIDNSRANLELLGGHFESLYPWSEGQGFILNPTQLKNLEIRTTVPQSYRPNIGVFSYIWKSKPFLPQKITNINFHSRRKKILYISAYVFLLKR